MFKKNKKASVSLYITFIIMALVIITITAFVAPMGVRFNSEMYKAGEQIMLKTNESIQSINNATVRLSVQNTISTALDAQENNIDVNAALFKYGWILMLGLTALILFLYTRRTVEFAGGFV